MAKAGRKRKQGERYPSGNVKAAADRPPALIKRMIDLAHARAADPLLTTPLGWLRVQGVLNDRQVAAGTAYATLVGQHDRVIGLPRRSVQSPSYRRGFHGTRGIQPELQASDPARVASARQRYDNAIAALQEIDPGGRIARVVASVCVDDCAPSWAERADLITGLDRLVLHFGLTR